MRLSSALNNKLSFLNPEFSEKWISPYLINEPEDLFKQVIYGNSLRNILMGNSQSNFIYGLGSNDIFIYSPLANSGGADHYFGGQGFDTLALNLMQNEWLSADFQSDLECLMALQDAEPGLVLTENFSFSAFELVISSIETIRVYVDGRIMSIADDAVNLTNDVVSIPSGVSYAVGNLLINDSVPDLVSSIETISDPLYGSAKITQNGGYIYTVNKDHQEVASLESGETITDYFTYHVVDADGDYAAATVEVVIEGPKPLPGYILEFAAPGDSTGVAVASAGDINNDGFDDLMIGAPTVNEDGVVYILYGGNADADADYSNSVDLGNLQASDGFVLVGDPESGNPGHSIATVGDVNGDGIDDVIIGASAHRERGQDLNGSAYVLFGVDAAAGETLPTSIELSDLSGEDGFVIMGANADDKLGYKVSSAGDVNGDGIDDIIVGAWGVDDNGPQSGTAYVIFGRDTETEGDFEPIMSVDTLKGVSGFAISGLAEGNRTGHSVAGLGDVNGDGIDDLAVGAYGTSVRGDEYSGEVYIIYGRDSQSGEFFDANVDLDELDGANGFRLRGPDAGDSAGRNVSNIGDINGDGIADILVAGYGYDQSFDLDGTVYVIYGRDTETDGTGPSTINLATLNGDNGFVIEAKAEGDLLGRSASAIGDMNGDGIGEFLIGAPNADPNGIDRAGEVYLIFGNQLGFDDAFDLNSLDGNNGYKIVGMADNEHTGYSVSTAGDLNGDGFEDMIIGGYGEVSPDNPTTGNAYVLYGGEDNLGLLDATDGATDGVIDVGVLTAEDFLLL